ncbi:Baseplate J family protein [Cellulomonas flavigena DSM 20109]|uniref:Baseplate J family protein n=1 Tax=Cellulomonas flavigena (strain ATCC 482 / DSM 20109 / BCRC 11376 / JCM 18109 / NBRC 3775 / NCIMB 8073 / NRS 134) TaxID=446466 RepID=D5UGR2_CELFN|nr:putative baseplate assembly protein [Cellulomonas flavigena]ADG75160.1 Baseplate J family protein [Cellulomonas flavigena DSM 20109]
MLPTPHLDDRRFQDLVDDAKRMVQRRCPEWTDHNVSDPGVTLIETVAFMTDELFYRLNRVPDRLYVTFLDLLGVRLHPAAAATVDVTMWLSAPQPEPVVVPEGTEVATPHSERDDAVVFTTTAALTVPPRRLAHLLTRRAGGEPVGHDEQLAFREPFGVFADLPQVDDALLLGLDDRAPSCVVVLRFDSDVQGVGVDPRHPPLVWEAWDGRGWVPCDVESDGTGGLNRPGDVVVHVPATHTASVLADRRAGWLRCRVVPPDEGYSAYSASPTVREASAFTIGGTVAAEHAETVAEEVLGLSEGVHGQVFELEHRPVVAGPPLTVEVAAGSGWETWTEVESFAGHGEQDRVLVVDRAAGEVHLAPALREPDGTLRAHGAVPPKGAPLRVPRYRTGGGPGGNVAAGTLRVLRGSVPFVDRVSNRRAAGGGVAAETVDEAKERGPLALRVRDRAVTAEDYEELARAATTGVARVRCVPAGQGADAGGVRVLVVPTAVVDGDGALRFEDLVPDPDLLAAIATHLDDRRPVGARVSVEPPFYQGVTVVARIVPRPRASVPVLQAAAVRALTTYFDPLSGGPDGDGWPFGRPVQAGEVYAVLQRLPGTELVEDVKLFAADPLTGRRGDPLQRIDLDRHALVFSFRHQVRVLEP